MRAAGVRDVEYLQVGDTALLARIYQPEGHGPFPAVVDVHGGAWTENDRLHNASIHECLTSAGIVVMALDFRMPPAAGYPESIAEINFGIRWLKSHARDFGSDGRLVGGLGTSSGGHQLLLSALRPSDPRYSSIEFPGASVEDARLAHVAVGWPVLDPLERYYLALERNDERLIKAHNAYFAGEHSMLEGNPLRMLEGGHALDIPPLLILQGTSDDRVPFDTAERFAAAYGAAGGNVEFAVFPEQPHAFMTRFAQHPQTARALQVLADFIHKHSPRLTPN